MAFRDAILVLLLSIVFVGTACAQFSCYVCQSPRDAVCDVFNDTIRSYDCSSLSYSARSEGFEPPLVRVVENERQTTNTTYGCIKAHITYANKTDGLIRTCFPKSSNIDDVCDFISREVNGYTVTDCHFCETLNCNSAQQLYISGILIIIALLLGFRQ